MEDFVLSKNILIVDDDEGLRKLIIKTLSKNGYHAEGVSTGKDAIEFLMNNNKYLILLDQTLPDMKGLDIVETLMKEGIKFDFIMMTGQGDERLAVDIMKLGARDYLVKDTSLLDFLPGIIRRTFQIIETENKLKVAENALLESRNLLDVTQQIAKIGGWEWNIEKQSITWTTETYRIHGINPEDIEPNSPQHLEESANCYKDKSIILEAFNRSIQEGIPYNIISEFNSCDGNELWVQTIGQPVFKNNKIIKIVGNIIDVTEQKKLEITQDKLREQLNHAQKMESIGRLAGGVAHDFNNMLSVILSSAQLALLRGKPNNIVSEYLNNIIQAGKKSSELTKQLLSFARKQSATPIIINLNESVLNIFEMLQRLIGENVKLMLDLDKSIEFIKVDPTQIDQILTNLCVNSRDAISSNGIITIKTQGFLFTAKFCKEKPGYIPGYFIMLEVSDNGCGMNGETLSHLFEPFFTTKGIGEGTGLGLATVYGIAQQNKGFVIPESVLGTGTSIKIFFPSFDKNNEKTVIKESKHEIHEENKVILLVEDEIMILEATAQMLEIFGYVVIKTTIPKMAIELAKNLDRKIDLLITDVIMPEINGWELANRIAKLYPEVSCLFMSGYTADVIGKSGILENEIDFILKPFTIEALSKKIKEIFRNKTNIHDGSEKDGY